jgi:hypothetical protein
MQEGSSATDSQARGFNGGQEAGRKIIRPIPDYQLPITDYRLPITDYPFSTDS